MAPDIRERVLACAKEHHYQPNALAMAGAEAVRHSYGKLFPSFFGKIEFAGKLPEPPKNCGD